MNETIPAYSPKVTRKYTSKRPLALILAILFFTAAVLSVVLIAKPEPTPSSDAPIVSAEPAEQTFLTVSKKINTIATAIETACYSNGTENMHEVFLYGTWTIFICIITSSLIMGTAFLMMFFSAKLSSFTRTCALAAGAITAITTLAIFIVMHIYSSIVIIGEFSKINAQNLDATVKDQKITETLTYLLRNLAVTAALGLYTYKFSSFAFAGDNRKLSLKKLKKLSKGFKSACVAMALVCCFFASTIALTWTFDFTAKTLLWMFILGAAIFFALTGFLHDYAKYVGKQLAFLKANTPEETTEVK